MATKGGPKTVAAVAKIVNRETSLTSPVTGINQIGFNRGLL